MERSELILISFLTSSDFSSPVPDLLSIAGNWSPHAHWHGFCRDRTLQRLYEAEGSHTSRASGDVHDSMINFPLFESNDPHTFLYAILNNLFRLNCHLSQYMKKISLKCKILFLT